MADYRLYCAGVSGNAYKAALMLNLSGCDWEPVVLDYIGGATRQESFREEINELGEIPVLEHGAKRLSQSGAILTYLAEKTGRFGGRDEDEKLEILRWILFDNHKFTSYFATLRFLVGIQKTGETPVTEFLRGRAQTAFGMVEKHLGGPRFPARRPADHRRHLHGGLSLLYRGDGARSRPLPQHHRLGQAHRRLAGLGAAL